MYHVDSWVAIIFDFPLLVFPDVKEECVKRPQTKWQITIPDWVIVWRLHRHARGDNQIENKILGTWCFKVSFFHLNEEFYRRSTNITDLLHMIDCPWLVFSLAWIFSMKVNTPLKLDLVKLNQSIKNCFWNFLISRQCLNKTKHCLPLKKKVFFMNWSTVKLPDILPAINGFIISQTAACSAVYPSPHMQLRE